MVYYYYALRYDSSLITIKSKYIITKTDLGDKTIQYLIPISKLEYLRLYLKTKEHYYKK